MKYMPRKFFVVSILLAAFIFAGASCISFKKSSQSGLMGLYRSSDKGESWQPAMAFPTAEGVKNIGGVKIYRIFGDPNDVNALYLGTRGQGLYYTYNNGDTWQSVPFLNNKFIYALAVDPKDKCNIFASDGAHIYKSEDCTRSWSQVFLEERTGERIAALDIDSADGTIWGVEVGGDVLISRDSGRSWTVIKRFNFQLQDIAVDPKTPGRVYIASLKSGLYRTDDAGVTWQDLRQGMKDFRDSQTFYRMAINPSEKDSIFWVSKYGILRSDDAGATWKDLQLLTRPGAVVIYSFAVNPKNQKELYYTGTILGDKNVHVRSTFYKSVDGGVTWTTKQLPTNTIPFAMKLHLENDNVLMLGFTTLN